MNLTTYQELSKRTMPAYENPMEILYTAHNYTLGLNGEAGEVAEIIKKHFHHNKNMETPIDLENLRKELGDVLHYLSGIATIFGISLEDVAITNIDKLKKRYPNGFNVDDSIARVDTK